MNTDRNTGIVVVLDRPQDAVNIGAVVRAIKNMAFSQLRLVNPRPYPAGAGTLAHHAEDVIAAIGIYPTLDEALADAQYVIGTSAIAHAARPLRRDIEPLARELIQRAQTGLVAVLFGTEDDGLDNTALDRCHTIAALPTNPAYPALNLAQSVLLFLYELTRQTASAAVPEPVELRAPVAAQAQLEQLFTLGEQALSEIGFFKYRPQAVMRTLRQLAYRAELQPQETALLMAIARQTLYMAERQAGSAESDVANKKRPVS